MDAEQRSLYQTVPGASLGYQRYLSASNRHLWWAWMLVLFAYLGIFFVLAILFSAAIRAHADSAFWVQLYQTVALLAVSN
jgi:uncharacterized membrane protein YhaH (DUF805 family)